MAQKTLLVTGAAGLIGSEACRHFAGRGWRIVGFDNDARQEFFGPQASVRPVREQLRDDLLPPHVMFQGDVCALDASDRMWTFEDWRSTKAVIHAAAQPAHEYGQQHPGLNWHTNVTATLKLLEVTRQHFPGAPFVFLSSSKVYGTHLNTRYGLIEGDTRYHYAAGQQALWGVDESCPTDQTEHTQYGASKLAADVLVQEYGHCYDMPVLCLRLGCVTGPQQAGVAMHGFLSHLVKTAVSETVYEVHGHQGKQVRDQLHAYDVVRACEEFIENPKAARHQVYNLGGGIENTISILEALAKVAVRLHQYPVPVQLLPEPRLFDQIVLINDDRRWCRDYPKWEITRPLDAILDELVGAAVSDAYAK